MTASTPTRTQAERADQTRARILAAAVRQFSANGLAGARTEQIAEEAGVNKALLYYYFKGKEDLYAATLEFVFEGMRTASIALLESSASAGERFLRIVLSSFDRSYSHPALQSLIHQEMVRLHRGEENRMARMAEKFFRPMWFKMEEVLKEGIASGELVGVDPAQMRYASMGANVFYFLSAPLTRLTIGTDPLSQRELTLRRQKTIEFLGQAIFVDRKHGANVAARVLAETPMPLNHQLNQSGNRKIASDGVAKGKVRHK
jgi:TetR/AcrR family transcriptional regulator